MTSASQDPRALALYARFGATPRWKNLYLEIAGTTATSNGDIHVKPAEAGDCGWELPVPNSQRASLCSSNGEIAAAAVVVWDPSHRRLQMLRAISPEPSSLPVLVEHLRGLAGPNGVLGMNIPDVHPALQSLGESRIVDADMWCADDSATAIDPTRELPSPAFG